MAERVAFVPTLVSSTVALGTALPDGSFTVPSTVPKVDWAKLAGASRAMPAIARVRQNARRLLLREGSKKAGFVWEHAEDIRSLLGNFDRPAHRRLALKSHKSDKCKRNEDAIKVFDGPYADHVRVLAGERGPIPR